MENFTFYSPTFFVFGKETENEAGKYIRLRDTHRRGLYEDI